MSGRRRAIDHRHARHAAICDRVVDWEHGTAVFAGDLPGFWNYNAVRVEGADPGLGVEALVAAADRLQGELEHRQVEVEDEAAGARLRPGFAALGWSTERLVWMELTGPARGAGAAAVEISELPFARTRELRETWFTSSGWMPSRDDARRFMDLEEIVAGRSGARALAAWDGGGEPIGYAAVVPGPGSAEVDQVYVHPQRRGGGVGGALVAAAVAAAGAATTFIVADDEEDAKRLYARLGFEPVWTQHVFTRRPDGAAA